MNSTQFRNYDEFVDLFLDSWHTMPGLATVKNLPDPPTTFTSDYALYWFDYLAGYDVMWAQFGWNHSRTQDNALIRGAARVQDKAWGAIVTWTYTAPPYLQDGQAVYQDMVAAYEAGAKYIVVFNYPKINSYGILQDEHFEALQKFWQGIKMGLYQKEEPAQAVLVLPSNYGWGMRNPQDSIWGLWGPDEKSVQVWNTSKTLLARYNTSLDIVYDDPNFNTAGKYQQVYYWNSTVEP
jgi:hypothetical protein